MKSIPEPQQLQRLREDNHRLRQKIQHLEKETRRLEQENQRLKQAKRGLEEQVQELQRAALRQAAPFRRQAQDKIAPEQQKRPGRKAGHPGSYRPLPDYIDEEVEVPLTGCPHCGGPVQDCQPVQQYIEEIPALRPRVSKITTYRGECPQCGPVQSSHPLQTSTAVGAAQVQLGPRALSVAALLNKGYGLTMRTTCQVLEQLLGLSLTPGGLSQALDRVAHKLQPSYEALIEQVCQLPAVFVDETSWWVGGPGWWLWVFTAPGITLFVVRSSRGSQVVLEILGEDFSGRLVSDCLASYDPLPYLKHKCISHHLQAISLAQDLPDTLDSSYLQEWRLFFKTVIVLHSLALSQQAEALVKQIQGLEQWCDRLIERPCTQAGDLTIQNRLRKQHPHLLGCLYDPAAEPTNNRAERALRPAVVARKLSCGNKTTQGKQTWEILASLAATCQQHETDFCDYLSSHLPLDSPRSHALPGLPSPNADDSARPPALDTGLTSNPGLSIRNRLPPA